MGDNNKIVRVTFHDFRKAFDLIEQNRLLENVHDISVRPGLIRWVASYLQEQTQMTSYHDKKSEQMEFIGRVPEGGKLGAVAFIIEINQLPSVTKWETLKSTNQDDMDEG